MKDKQGLSRRDFIRNSMIAGGAMLLSGMLPSKAGIPAFTDSEDFNLSGTDELLRGVSDIHLHAAPDSKARLGNELEFARAAHDAGFRSIRKPLHESGAWRKSEHVRRGKGCEYNRQSLPLHLDAYTGCCLPEYPVSWEKRGYSRVG